MSIPGRPMPDNNTDYVKEAEINYNVQVKFVSRAKLHTSVLVKGCEKEASRVQDAARALCFHMCGSVSTFKTHTMIIDKRMPTFSFNRVKCWNNGYFSN